MISSSSSFSFLVLLFFVVKVCLCFGFVGFAAWCDVRSRFVSNWVWVFFAPLAFVVSLVECLLCGFSLFVVLGSMLLFGGVGLVLFFCGVWGGADAKCFVCLSLLFPLFPLSGVWGFMFGVFLVAWVFAFGFGGFFLNFACNVHFWLFRGCLFEGDRFSVSWLGKFLVLFWGRRVVVGRLDDVFFTPLERVDRLDFNIKREEFEGVVGGLRDKYGDSGLVWAASTVPFVLWLLVGVVFWFFFYLVAFLV